MLASLGLVALAAIAAVLTTTGVVVSQKREAAQGAKDFEQYKLEAGEKIASANAVAALANERAGHEALERAKLEMEFVKQGPRFTLLRADNGQDVKAALPPAFPFDEETVLIEVGEHPTPISTPYAKPVK
jgi:hypothetical protein